MIIYIRIFTIVKVTIVNPIGGFTMTDQNEILERLSTAIQTYKKADAVAAAQDAIAAGINPVTAINEGLVKGMNIVGEKFKVHKVYLPQVLTAASALYGGLDVLLPAIPQSELRNARKATVAVVEGDVHDIGKNILRTLLTAGGFIVTDLGKDIPASQIAKAAQENNSDAVCVSSLMTTTMEGMKKVVDNLVDNGYRDKVLVTIGGPPTSPEFAASIDADHRDSNAQDAVAWLSQNQRHFRDRDPKNDLGFRQGVAA